MRTTRIPAYSHIRILALALLLAPTGLHAQSIRVSGTTTARYIDMKPITTQERVSLVPLTQDININVWGFGRGARFYAELRGRASIGDSATIWPQANDNFDVLAAYAELDRTYFRVRAGRQWKASPLGFYNYDGASLLLRASRTLRAELYGGWSLLAGESDNFGTAVTDAIEPFKPKEKRNLIGAQLQLRPSPLVNLSALYQREVRTDRAGLYSERLAGEANVYAGPLTLAGGVQADLAMNQINQARTQVTLPLPGRFIASAEARIYKPYFDLWTIWGMFNPIGFRETTANLNWSSAHGATTLHLGGGRRRYDDDGGGVEFDRMKETGWRALADASFTPRPDLTLFGSYRADVGFGATKSDGSVGARLNFGESNYMSFTGMAFQTVQELQVREGTVFGAGTDASFKLSNSSRLGWSLALYRHDNKSPADEIDWSQMRASVWLEWVVGSNPDKITRVAGRLP